VVVAAAGGNPVACFGVHGELAGLTGVFCFDGRMLRLDEL